MENAPPCDERQHDVGVEHGGIDTQFVDRHQGHPRAQLRGPRDGEDVVALAQLAIGGEAAPRLAQ